MKAKEITIFLILLISFPLVFAQNIPTIVPYVNDFAGVLSQQEVDSINSLAAEIERNTTVQVAVLTVNSTQPLTIDEYANQAFRQNGIGQRDKNNGLLIVAAVADRKWRIEVGYGLEGLINDAKAGDIGRNYLVPNFQNGDYGTGLYDAVDAVGRIVQGQPEVISSASTDQTSIVLIVLAIFGVFLLPIFIFLIFFLRKEFYQKCPKDGTRLHMHIRKDGIIYECAKCGYKKKKKRRKYVWVWFGGIGGGWTSGGGYGGGGGGFGGGSSGGGGAGGGW